MIAFVLRRFIESIPVLFLATVLIFLGLRMLPGDPALILAGQDANPETLAAIRQDNGLDQPLPVQYAIWLKNVVRGDLGVSFFTKTPVAQLLGQRIPATLELGIAGMLLSVVLGIPTGIVAAVQSHRTPDWLVSAFNGLAVALPGFWLGILSIILFSLILGWLPPGGHGDFFRDPLGEMKFLLLPAITLALPFAAGLSRLVKGSMLEVLGDDYVRTARAKGVTEDGVVWHHALRNALVPVATILGLQFGRLLGGAVITESVFSWPGIGRLIRDSIGNRDYAVVQACLLLLVVVFIVINLLTDITYGVLDPRIRLSGGRAR
ncbi:MAG: ABC transporter permease [Chloroflexi bacterium]|nr:ABC transporter permease [Chloroflexota bacterium]MBV9898550.1 ABC transporter permease [Chloroflexota bacterium]